ncbi:MAG: MFS transporter [Anaerolineae bacterium]|nr:MFS transporter [Anaerolineae bacterium]
MSRPLLPAKAVYFFFFAAGAALVPFLPIFYKNLGFSGSQIGLLTAFSPLMTMIAAPVWGGIADATRRHKQVLFILVGGGMLSVAWLSQMRQFGWLAAAAASLAFFVSPIIPLLDDSVLALLGEHRADYGKQRMWGAIGWGVSAPLAGWATERMGMGWPFGVYLVCMTGFLLVATRLQVTSESVKRSYWSGVRLLLADRRWIIFLGVMFISGAGSMVITNFLFLYLSELGAGEAVMGVALAVGTLGEVPMLFLSGWMIRKWGARGVLAIGLAAYVLRAFGLSIATQPWQALALQLLHGLTFSAVWAASVSYARQIAPRGLGATAQGLVSSMVMGLSGIVGSLAGGVLFERLGGAGLFRVSALAVLGGLVLFLAAWKAMHARPVEGQA